MFPYLIFMQSNKIYPTFAITINRYLREYNKTRSNKNMVQTI